jgi:RNA polymerase sigma factor (sigma-70 family)
MISSEQITAFEMQDFLARERRRIIGLCATITRNVEVAEDLAQETLYEAWRCRSNLRNTPYANEWLSGIARNVCRRWLQRKSRDEAHVHASPDEIDGEIGMPLDAIPDDLDIEAEVERAELAQLLDRAMAQLSVETRTILRGHFIDETTHAEMALRLGLSENALSVRLHRGKRALRRLLMTDFAESVESYGVTSIASETWTETHIWCSLCGQERLQGRLDRSSSPGKFSLLCRNCFAQTGQLFHNSDTTLTQGCSAE